MQNLTRTPCSPVFPHASKSPPCSRCLLPRASGPVVSDRNKVFFIFSQGPTWARGDLPGRESRFGRAGSEPCGMLAFGMEGGDGCGWWQPPVAGHLLARLRPFCLADWCDVPSTCLPGRSILKPWSDLGLFSPGRIGGDRCLGLLTQAVVSHHTWWCWRGILA